MPVEQQSRVLVVDDEADIVRAYSRILMSAGHVVETASNGIAAVERFRQGRFDVVVSDITMPLMDGVQLLRAIREHDLDVPVLLITASPSVETAMKAVELGALRYLEKPVEMSELLRAVDYAVSLCRATRLKRQLLEESGDLRQQITDRAGLTVKFESALRNLWMAYQPIVQASTRTVFAYEALVRSREPAIPHPGALFDAAEKLDRVRDVGRVIRDIVPAPIDRAPEQSLLFVNLHTQDLDDPLLHSPDSPLAAIASRTVLEVTERASLDQVKDVRDRIASLRKLGFRIALDDIGAGYAGLSSFAAIEPDVVKIDMSLVRDVHRSTTKQRLITSLVTLCESLGKLVIAEGVENADEIATLRALGCDYFQGYYFARPEAPFATVNWAEKSAA